MKGYKQIWKAIADEIKEDIINGVYKPGDRLKETVLAGKYSISKTPVREALRYLGGIGFVEIIPNRMARVKKMDSKEIENLFRIQTVLEGLAARDAIKNLSECDFVKLEEMTTLTEEFAGSESQQKYEKSNEGFHSIFYQKCGNEKLVEMIHNLHEQLMRLRSIPRCFPEEFRILSLDHRKIYEAAVRKDADNIEKFFRMHIEQYQQIILRLLKKEKDR